MRCTVILWLLLATHQATFVVGRSATDVHQQQKEQDDALLQTKTVKKPASDTTSPCQLSLKGIDNDLATLWTNDPQAALSIALHRSGEVEPCAAVSLSKEVLEDAMTKLGFCQKSNVIVPDKYQMETALTQAFLNVLDEASADSCGSTDNSTAPEGLTGYCDMGPSRMVIQNDHDLLVPLANSNDDFPNGTLPCRYYTREGRRIDSADTLLTMALRALTNGTTELTLPQPASKEACISEDGQVAEGNCGTVNMAPSLDGQDKVLHLYAVPAGRMFMFAPKYIGERFLVHEVEDWPDPIVVETLSLEPRVFELYNFFSSTEAKALIDKALSETSETHKMHRSTTGAVGGSIFARRTSENAWITHTKDALRIKRRCLDFLGMDEYWESHTDGLQLLRYQNGQAYTGHMDYLDGKGGENYDYDTAGVGGNRFATILLYLSDVGDEDGGETMFQHAWPVGTSEETKNIPLKETIRELREAGETTFLKPGSWEETMLGYCRTRLAIKPKESRAVLFYSQHPNGEEDKSSFHGACPVLNGTKWAANLWVWSGPRPEFPNAPKRWPDKPAPSQTTQFKQIYGEFRNTGKDPRFTADTKLYYDEDGFFGNLGPNDPPIGVNTYVTHRWNIKVNGKTLKTFEITKDDDVQIFEI